MKLTAIVAMTPERVIGAGGELPWHQPEDLAHFKKITMGHPILMGRKTYESIGRPLPGRQNIVLTRTNLPLPKEVLSISSLSDLERTKLQNNHIYVIGGREIYQLLLPKFHEIIVTHLKKSYPGDTYFPAFEQKFPQKELLQKQEHFNIIRHTKNAEPFSKSPNLGKDFV